MPSRPTSRSLAHGDAEPHPFTPDYVTRKRLTANELLTAGGIGLGIALACFYVAKVWLERTPVLPPTRPPAPTADDAPAGALHRTVTPQRAAP